MHYGSSVAINNGIIAISAQDENMDRFHNKGAVYLYKKSESGDFVLTQKIQNQGTNRFGNDLSMSGQWLLVGELYGNIIHDDGSVHYGNFNVGAAHLYKIKKDGTAQLTSSIYSPNPRESGKFGHSVAIDGDRLVVGAPGEDSDNGSQSGVVYVYQILEDGKVRLLESFIHPTGKANDQFGQSLSISGLNILVGAPGYDLDNDRWNAGSAVLFRASQ